MNTLETHVLELIGEDTSSPDVFSDDDTGMAPIRESLNDAIEEISMLTGSGKRTYHLPLKADHHFYRLDFRQDDIAWLTNVWIFGRRRRLDQVDFNWLLQYNPRWLHNSGPPERYFMIGVDIVGFHPMADTSSDILEIEAVVIPDRYTSDEERIKLRDDYQWAAVYYAVGEFYAGRGDAKNAIANHNKYLKRLGIQQLYPEQAEREYGLGRSSDPYKAVSERSRW